MTTNGGKLTVADAFKSLKRQQNLGGGITAGFARIGIKGKVFTLYHQKQPYRFIREDDNTVLPYIDVVVLDANPECLQAVLPRHLQRRGHQRTRVRRHQWRCARSWGSAAAVQVLRHLQAQRMDHAAERWPGQGVPGPQAGGGVVAAVYEDLASHAVTAAGAGVFQSDSSLTHGVEDLH